MDHTTGSFEVISIEQKKLGFEAVPSAIGSIFFAVSKYELGVY
jgi:hypothetical protein